MPHSQEKGRRMEWTGMRRLLPGQRVRLAGLLPCLTRAVDAGIHDKQTFHMFYKNGRLRQFLAAVWTGRVRDLKVSIPPCKVFFNLKGQFGRADSFSWAAPKEPSNLAFHTISLSSESESSTTKQSRNTYCDGAVSAVALPPAPNLGRRRLSAKSYFT
jgi:hypothetical protein